MKELIACERNPRCQRSAQARHAEKVRKGGGVGERCAGAARGPFGGHARGHKEVQRGKHTSSEMLKVVATVQNELQMKHRLTDRLTDRGITLSSAEFAIPCGVEVTPTTCVQALAQQWGDQRDSQPAKRRTVVAQNHPVAMLGVPRIPELSQTATYQQTRSRSLLLPQRAPLAACSLASDNSRQETRLAFQPTPGPSNTNHCPALPLCWLPARPGAPSLWHAAHTMLSKHSEQPPELVQVGCGRSQLAEYRL